MPRYASYVRVSDKRQEGKGDVSQLESIKEWFAENEISEWDQYADISKSGANLKREEFGELIEAVEDDQYDVVVMSEISRLARITYKTSEFIHYAMDTDTRIVLLDEMIEEISNDDPFSKFVANILAAIYEQEREQTIRRIQRGKRAARNAGKWTSRPPVGFRTTDRGYLEPILVRQDGEEEKDTFLDVQQALEQVENGMSYYEAAKSLNMTQQTLGSIHRDDRRRRWYLDQESDDDRVEEALEGVS